MAFNFEGTTEASLELTSTRCAAEAKSPLSLSRAAPLLRVGLVSQNWNSYLALLGVFLIGSLGKASECVRFDVPDLVTWEDVTTADFSKSHPAEKLVAISFEISAFVHHRSMKDLFQVTYIAEFPERHVRIDEYHPGTELQSDIAGSINVTRLNENSSNLGLSANAKIDTWISANGNASQGARNSENVQFQKNPGKEWIGASGTLSRGTAVYFKLRPSSQTTLEGSRRFELVLRAPKDLRADFFRLKCAAYSSSMNAKKSTPICGLTTFLVGAIQEGDMQAYRDVNRFLESETELRSTARTFHDQMFPKSKNDFKSVFDSIMGKKRNSSIPRNWLQQIESQRAASRTIAFEKHLPIPVREAISSYRLAKINMFGESIAKL